MDIAVTTISCPSNLSTPHVNTSISPTEVWDKDRKWYRIVPRPPVPILFTDISEMMVWKKHSFVPDVITYAIIVGMVSYNFIYV